MEAADFIALEVALKELKGEWEDISSHMTMSDIEAFGRHIKESGEVHYLSHLTSLREMF